jgi:LCP family protein required for cell wall assembly
VTTSHPAARARRKRGSVMPWMMLIVAVIGAGGAAGVLRAADERTADVERIGGLESVLAPVSDSGAYPGENFLLVGSDTREGVDPDSDDFGAIGGVDAVSGRRSDTIMVLRQERDGGASIVSVPRDLWVPIAGTDHSQRVNTAYNEGPARLVATVSQALGIPINHYVEVDFIGFKNIVDEIGGVEVCVTLAARDTHSGLVLEPGCQKLQGVMALAYARSRYYEQLEGDDWNMDPTADLGRIKRQQHFIRGAVDGLLAKMQSSPFDAGDAIQAVSDSVKIDSGLDPIKAGTTLRAAAGAGIRTFALPVYPDTVGDAAVLRMGGGADALLAYFRGETPPPAEFETTADPAA